MKKTLKILVMFFLLLIICSCEKKEYNLIELTGEELVKNLMSEDEKDIVFAIYNSDSKKGESFLTDLENASKSTKLDIYYIDYNHIDSTSSLFLFDVFSLIDGENYYYAFINGEFKVQTQYTDFKTLYSDLKTISYKSEIERIPDEEKEEYIKTSNELYDEGKIGSSSDLLDKAWTLNVAKDLYKEKSYYNLFNLWENVEYLNKKTFKINYTTLYIIAGVDALYINEKQGIYDDDFEKPEVFSSDDLYYYYIKDNCIYTSSEKDGNYKKEYEIISIEKNILKLKKNNKDYIFTIRS